MTEELLNLAEQAGFYVYEDRAYIPTISEDVTTYLEQFAELLKKDTKVFCDYCGGNDEHPQEHCTDCTKPQSNTCKGIPRVGCSYLAGCDKPCNKCGEVHKHHQMVAQFYALEKDAKRYRWLREQHWSDNLIAVVFSPKDKVRLGTDCPSETRLDELIDGIMKD